MSDLEYQEMRRRAAESIETSRARRDRAWERRRRNDLRIKYALIVLFAITGLGIATGLVVLGWSLS